MKRQSRTFSRAATCAAILFIVALGFSIVTVRADSAAETVRKAQQAMRDAEAAEKAVKEAKDAADKAATKSGPLQDDEGFGEKPHKVAERADSEADKAANAADDAQDEAQKQRQEAEAAAAAAAAAKGKDADKNAEAAKQQEEANAAAEKAKEAEAEAAKKEKESDEANRKARESDRKIMNDQQSNVVTAARVAEKNLRRARRKARQARRAAAQAIYEAEKEIAQQAARVGGNQSATQKLKDELEEEKRKLAAMAKADPSSVAGSNIPNGNFIPQPVGSGIQTGEFNVPAGRIIVTLPDDIRAGDTISGTVIAEPNGKTKEERDKNASLLTAYSIAGVSSSKVPVAVDKDEVVFVTDFYSRPGPAAEATDPARPGVVFRIPTASPTPTGPVQVNVGVFLIQNINDPVAPCVRPGQLTQINEGCSPISQLVFRQPDRKSGFFIQEPDEGATQPLTSEGIFVFTRPNPDIPAIGQTGRPIVITGPFDGNATNTGITCEPVAPNQPPPTYTPGQPIYVIAESPRRTVFISPTNITGPVQVTVNEGGKKATVPFRNVGVNLNAPKTNLLKGEKTVMTVQVNGLQGITKNVSIDLSCSGAVTMEGGTQQTLVIQPSQVGAGGVYTMTRSITGVRPGNWAANATVMTRP